MEAETASTWGIHSTGDQYTPNVSIFKILVLVASLADGNAPSTLVKTLLTCE